MIKTKNRKKNTPLRAFLTFASKSCRPLLWYPCESIPVTGICETCLCICTVSNDAIVQFSSLFIGALKKEKERKKKEKEKDNQYKLKRPMAIAMGLKRDIILSFKI